MSALFVYTEKFNKISIKIIFFEKTLVISVWICYNVVYMSNFVFRQKKENYYER